MQEKIKELAIGLGKKESEVNDVFKVLRDKYVSKVPGKTNAEYDEMAFNMLTLRLKKLLVLAAAKRFNFVVLGQDPYIKDWLAYARGIAINEREKDLPTAIQKSWCDSTGVLLDGRQSLDRAGKFTNRNFRHPIGCHICLPLIEAGKWKELIDTQEARKQQGCTCELPQLYFAIYGGFLDENKVFKKGVLTLSEDAAFYKFDNTKMYEGQVLIDDEDDEYLYLKTNTTASFKVVDDKVDILKLKSIIPNLFVEYKNIMKWLENNKDANGKDLYNTFFITETNIASIAPTMTANGSRLMQFDDYEEIDSMDIPTFIAYLPEEQIENKLRVGMRVLIVGKVYKTKDTQEKPSEVKLIAYMVNPIGQQVIPEIKGMS